MELDEQNNLKVTNKETGEEIPAVPAKTKKEDAPPTWRVQDGDHAPIYFTEQDGETCRLRKKMERLPKEVRNIRNNVERTSRAQSYREAEPYRFPPSGSTNLQTLHLPWRIASRLHWHSAPKS